MSRSGGFLRFVIILSANSLLTPLIPFNYGVAIIIFTLLSKLVILPFQMKSKKSMMEMQKLQPKLRELEKKYKDDKERYALETQKLYKKEGVSMFGGCLPMLITLPIMIGL